MSILITGGTGSFGHAMTRRLLAEGVQRIVIYSRTGHLREPHPLSADRGREVSTLITWRIA